jgi:hypothetical protein
VTYIQPHLIPHLILRGVIGLVALARRTFPRRCIGRHLNVPVVRKSREEVADHFGWIAMFFAMDGPASSVQTQERLGWRPVEPGLIADLNAEHYFEHTADAAVLQG